MKKKARDEVPKKRGGMGILLYDLNYRSCHGWWVKQRSTPRNEGGMRIRKKVFPQTLFKRALCS